MLRRPRFYGRGRVLSLFPFPQNGGMERREAPGGWRDPLWRSLAIGPAGLPPPGQRDGASRRSTGRARASPRSAIERLGAYLRPALPIRFAVRPPPAAAWGRSRVKRIEDYIQ